MRVTCPRLGLLCVLSHGAFACSGGAPNSQSSDDRDLSTSQDPSVISEEADLPPSTSAAPLSDPFGHDAAPVVLDTLAATEVAAGQQVLVRCEARDDRGEPVDTSTVAVSIRAAPQASIRVDQDGRMIAQTAGMLHVSCAIDDLRLVDETPAQVRVLPGVPTFVETALERRSIVAGERVSASCRATDAFGNEAIDAEATLRIAPSETENHVSGLTAELTQGGIYEVACELPGAETRPQQLEVLAGSPVALTIATVPQEAVYAVGQVIEVESSVRDAYGNAVPWARVTLASEPFGTSAGQARLRYFEEGTYRITATTPDAVGNPLVTETRVAVDGLGPRIRCGGEDPTLGPRDGGMWRAAAGTSVPFVGSVSDSHGVAALLVNGQPAALDGAGHFTASLTVRFGVNVVNIVARDTFGAENTRLCAFIASERFLPENDFFADDVVLALTQDAIDDRVRVDGVDSLNDLLDSVVTSAGLRTSLHQALLAANPLKPNSCDQKVLGVCVLRSEIRYLESRLDGPNATALTLLDGGMHVRLHLENVRVRLDVGGTLDSKGWVNIASMDVDADMTTRLSGGRPRVAVRDDSVTVSVGSISTDFSGLSGSILEVALSLAKGRVRGLVVDAVGDWVHDHLDTALDGAISGLDIRTLGSTVEVPRLDGGAPIAVGFGLDFSSLATTRSRLTFGVATRFSTRAVHSLPSLGIPMPPGDVRKEVSGPGAALVSIHSGLFSQLMHALWRGGLFEAVLSGKDLGGDAVAGLSLALSAALPPVTLLREDGRAQIDLASLRVLLRYPGLFETPLELWFSARVLTRVTLEGNDLAFSELEIDELFFSAPGTSLDGDTRDAIERLLLSLVQRLVGRALNDALPALPIPSFTLPSVVATFGLTPGMELGLVEPALSVEGQHFLLRSDFGKR